MNRGLGPNGLNDLLEVPFEFSFNLIGKMTIDFSTGQSWLVLKSWYTDGGLQQGFRCCFADRLNQHSGNPITVTLSPGPFEIQDGIPAPAMQPAILYLKGSRKSPGHNNPASYKNGNKMASYLFFEFIQLL